jgi:tRNA(Leu) C34 or U34 (ribose-2'-O)-methylase TrmL
VKGTRGYAAIGLFHPKTPANVGGVLRAVGCYGASMVAVEGRRFHPSVLDTQRQYKHTPLLYVDDLHSVIPFDCVPVAVEIVPNARPLQKYTHPHSAFYVFGPEDGTLGAKVLSWCRDVIYIPTNYCMNLAATANVVLYDRMSKRSKP